MPQFNHSGLEAEPPLAAGFGASGLPAPSWATHTELCLCARSCSGISVRGVQLLAVPFSISGNKRLKITHKPSCFFFQQLLQEGKCPTESKTEVPKFWRTRPYYRMLDPHLCFSSNSCSILKKAGSWEGHGGSSTLSLQGR